MGLGIREAIRLVQEEGSQASGEEASGEEASPWLRLVEEGEPGELSLEEASPEEGVEGEEMGQDEGEQSPETAQKQSG